MNVSLYTEIWCMSIFGFTNISENKMNSVNYKVTAGHKKYKNTTTKIHMHQSKCRKHIELVLIKQTCFTSVKQTDTITNNAILLLKQEYHGRKIVLYKNNVICLNWTLRIQYVQSFNWVYNNIVICLNWTLKIQCDQNYNWNIQ